MEPQNAEKLSITLPPEMARIIREKVSSGAYRSNSEVIREALRGWLDRDRRLAALDSAIARGVADADAGRVHGIDEVRAHFGERPIAEALVDLIKKRKNTQSRASVMAAYQASHARYAVLYQKLAK